ncbi:MAG: oligoendopeptidase [Thermoleophilaceae bacterium]|nr:oligoendopeptidase [Thermoleophilaceae bacterium]
MATDVDQALADPELEQTEWDLDPLVDGRGAEGVEQQLTEAVRLAGLFADGYAGRVAELDSAALATAMHELEQVYELVSRAGSYAALRFATDTADPTRGALLQRAQERSTEIETKLLFLELEWAAIPDERAEELLADPALEFCRHYLETVRRYRPHLLTEPEERVLTEKSVTGRSAWSRLFAEVTSAMRVKLDDGEVPLEVALSRLQSPDREARRSTAEAISAALEPTLRTRAYIFNTLLHDKAVDDRLRDYTHWLASRNLSNEASDESVQALITAVKARYDFPQRWFRLKARLLGVERLADYDRMAAVTDEDTVVRWHDARELVTECYDNFSADLGDIVRRSFEDRWIDAPLRPAKRGGAFCASTVPELHPYVMLNYTAKRNDVLTLAHELGHGVHAVLGARQGIFHMSTPLTMAETASTFGEEIVFDRLLEMADTPESRLSLLAHNIEGSIATVFRQTAMNQFEDQVHTARRSEGELAIDRINELWIETQREMVGDSVDLTDGYRTWWSYVPHFVNTPGYVYAYAYGQLLALSVYKLYREQGDAFVPRYIDMLAAGGSRSPEEIGRIGGVDLTDPGFWDAGLELVDESLRKAEAAAREAGRI